MSEFSINPENEENTTPAPEIDEAKAERFMHELRAQQSFGLAILAGFFASIIAAVIWATVTYATGYQIGFMAIGVGIVVGFAVRYFGNGLDMQFGIVGAVFALFGCLLGNLLVVFIYASRVEGIPVLDLALGFLSSPGAIIEVFSETFSFMDLLFYGIAVYEGYQFSFRKINEDELTSLQKT